MRRHLVQVLLDDTHLASTVTDALRQIDANFELIPFSSGPGTRQHESCDARIVVTRDARSLTNGKLERLLAWCDGIPCATLVLSDVGLNHDFHDNPATNGVPIGFASGVSTDDLAGRLELMCSLRPALVSLRSQLESARHEGREDRQRLASLNGQLQRAGQMQRGLHHAPPPMHGANAHTLFAPAQTVSGDVCEIIRLDDSHVALVLADVTGHGLAAGLLAAFVKRSLRGSASVARGRRIREPDEVLDRANQDLLEAAPPECEFATAVYAVYDERTRMIRWARAGAPFPILIRSGHAPQPLVSDGPLLGVLPNATFPTAEYQLEPDDTVLFTTDGLDAPTLGEGDDPLATDLHHTEWCRELAGTDADKLFARLEQRLATIDAGDTHRDDVTAIALHVDAEASVSRSPSRENLEAATV